MPLGLLGLAFALSLIPNVRSPTPGGFDWTGFAMTGAASLGLIYSLEAMARNAAAWPTSIALLIASLALGVYAVHHAMRVAHPLLDLVPFRVPSFAITVGGGLLFRAAISATPFLLPLMFQLGFGLDPFRSGLLLLAVFAGNLGMKPATGPVLARFGFRPTLIWNGTLAMAMIVACALFSADTPTPIVVAILFIGGLSRSMEFTTINALSFSDLDHARMSGANTLFSMLQQMGNALGVAGAAVLLRIAAAVNHSGDAQVTVTDFRLAFVGVGLAGLLGVFQFRRLAPGAGAALRTRPSGGKG